MKLPEIDVSVWLPFPPTLVRGGDTLVRDGRRLAGLERVVDVGRAAGASWIRLTVDDLSDPELPGLR